VSTPSALGVFGTIGNVPCRPEGIPDGLSLCLSEVGVVLPQSDDIGQDAVIHFLGGGGVHGSGGYRFVLLMEGGGCQHPQQ